MIFCSEQIGNSFNIIQTYYITITGVGGHVYELGELHSLSGALPKDEARRRDDRDLAHETRQAANSQSEHRTRTRGFMLC